MMMATQSVFQSLETWTIHQVYDPRDRLRYLYTALLVRPSVVPYGKFFVLVVWFRCCVVRAKISPRRLWYEVKKTMQTWGFRNRNNRGISVQE